MNLLKRKWKPKQKLRKEDIPFLLAEYRVSKNISYALLPVATSLVAISAAIFITSLANPDIRLEFMYTVCALAFFMLLPLFYYFYKRAERIAKVLEIEKRLERYGID